jgi:hypothetical protein
MSISIGDISGLAHLSLFSEYHNGVVCPAIYSDRSRHIQATRLPCLRILTQSSYHDANLSSVWTRRRTKQLNGSSNRTLLKFFSCQTGE